MNSAIRFGVNNRRGKRHALTTQTYRSKLNGEFRSMQTPKAICTSRFVPKKNTHIQ